MEPSVFVTAPFPTQLEKQARIEAAKRGVSRAELIRLAVSDYLQRLEQPPKKQTEVTHERG